jgi:hypothetical protein
MARTESLNSAVNSIRYATTAVSLLFVEEQIQRSGKCHVAIDHAEYGHAKDKTNLKFFTVR